MMNKQVLKKCKACEEPFDWNDKVIEVNDEHYHQDCVTLYPTGYVAFLDDECLGEIEYDDGTFAWEVLEEGQYVEDN